MDVERVVELARAHASDAWAERRGYTARSLQPVVAEAYAWSMEGTEPSHLIYESIEEAALALQDFLYANQNRLARGRLLGGVAATRPLPVWRVQGDITDRGSSRLVDVDVDLGDTLNLGHGPVPL